MDPIAVHNLFGIQGLNIRWYAIIICLGIICGGIVAVRLAKKRGYNSDLIFDYVIIALVAAIICARAYYVIFEWPQYAANPIKIFAIWEGGLAIYGGVIGAVIVAVLFCKHHKLPFGDLMDVCAPGLILGQCIGRWGNFVNQEAYGNLVTDAAQQWFPWSVYIDAVGEWHQATFFYESFLNLLVFILLILYFKRAKRRGNVFVMYLAAYGVCRFVVEGFRTDSLWLIPDFIRVSQLIGIMCFIIGTGYLLIMHNREQKSFVYEGKYRLGYVDPNPKKRKKSENVESNANIDEKNLTDTETEIARQEREKAETPVCADETKDKKEDENK